MAHNTAQSVAEPGIVMHGLQPIPQDIQPTLAPGPLPAPIPYTHTHTHMLPNCSFEFGNNKLHTEICCMLNINMVKTALRYDLSCRPFRTAFSFLSDIMNGSWSWSLLTSKRWNCNETFGKSMNFKSS